jgi:hypothetical protein
MPFNQAAWKQTGVTAALEDRFERLCRAEDFRFISSPRGLRMPHHQRYGATLNHDGFLPGQAEEKEMLDAVVEESAVQMRNFLDHGCRGPRVYVYQVIRMIDLERLEAALTALAHDDDYVLLVVDECKDPNWPRQRPPSKDRMIILPIPPELSGQWSLRVEEWARFESELADMVLDAMDMVGGGS